MSSFDSLPISKQWTDKLKKIGITSPSPIQAAAIPKILAGQDVVAQSQTGTGKTLAYLLPIIEKLEVDRKAVQAVILVPTHELGAQIVKEAERLLKGSALSVASLIGGAAISRQIEKLRTRPELVVGTPGRVMELITSRKLSMHYVRTIVVDEVDQVLALGSMGEVELILNRALRDRQICFFSATMPETVEPVVDRWMHEPVRLDIKEAARLPETIKHHYFMCEARDKIDTLRRLVRLYNPRSAIVFVNQVDDIAEVLAKLKYAGLSVEALYGEAGKMDRANVMRAFRGNRFQILLATDIAARGLDISHVSIVFNLDPPLDADRYVHRAGRTGRMGRKGLTISIISPQERFIIDKFSRQLDIEIKPKAMYRGEVFDVEPGKELDRNPRRPTMKGSGSNNDDTTFVSDDSSIDSSIEVQEMIRDEVLSNYGKGSGINSGRNTRLGTRSKSRNPASSSTRRTSKLGARTRSDSGSNSSEKSGSKKSTRRTTNKNKGAPRWLKDKPQR